MGVTLPNVATFSFCSVWHCLWTVGHSHFLWYHKISLRLDQVLSLIFLLFFQFYDTALPSQSPFDLNRLANAGEDSRMTVFFLVSGHFYHFLFRPSLAPPLIIFVPREPLLPLPGTLPTPTSLIFVSLVHCLTPCFFLNLLFLKSSVTAPFLFLLLSPYFCFRR